MIDLAPYQRICDASAPCPAPYACVDDGTDHDTLTTCLVPCADDVECPLGFFCNGVTQSADTGARYHCAANL